MSSIGRRLTHAAGALALLLVPLHQDVRAAPAHPGLPAVPLTAPAAQAPFCFQETGFCIENPQLQNYFRQRGGTRILGFPVSREFTLEGFRVQFFQRVVLQLQGDRVERLNLLDPNLMPMTRANRSTFPPTDPAVASAAPAPNTPNYGQAVLQFVRSRAPETWNGLPVRFFTLFNSTVPIDVAFPGGAPDPGLVALLNLEVWGFPTSDPAPDPNNRDFVYQRFQRGIMHYRNDCRCTDGILVGDYFKSVITGRNLPPDLEADMQGSRYLHQYSPGGRYSVARPAALRDTNLTGAFEPGAGSVPPPEERPRLTLTAADLSRLNGVLAASGLSAGDVNVAQTVTSAVPAGTTAGQTGGVVMMSAPLLRPPSADERSLLTAPRDVPVGVLKLGRGWSVGDTQVASLPPDIYLIKVRQGQMVYVSSAGREFVPPSLKAQMRGLSRPLERPQSIFTVDDVCYSWNTVQVCTQPSLRQLLTADEQKQIGDAAAQAVAQLARAGVLTPAEVSNVNSGEAVADAEGRSAVAMQRASLVAAPTMSFPAAGQEVTNGALLGVVTALLDVEVPGFPTLPRGVYAVRAQQRDYGEWRAVFTGADRRQFEIPADLVEVRGQIDRPMAIVLNLRIGLCFWEC